MERQEVPQLPQLTPKMIRNIVIGVILLLVLLWGTTTFYTVQEHEKAAVLTFGKLTNTVDKSGLHFKLPWPIQEAVKVPANIVQRMQIGYRETNGQITTVETESMMITGDENIVSADAVVEWKIINLEDYLYNIDDPEQFLRNSAIASIRSVMGANKLDFAITEGKSIIQQEAKEKLEEVLSLYNTGIFVSDLKFQDIEPPEGTVSQAFKEVTNAREQKNTTINEANKYRNERLPQARGESQAKLEKAEAEKKTRILGAEGDVAQYKAIHEEYLKNPDVTQDRLVLETLEKILPNAQIIITNSNSDTVNYLPLNELLKNKGGAAQ